MNDPLEPPDAVLVNRRWIRADTVDWARQANAILVEHGAVSGTGVYPKRWHARYRAQKLIGLLDDLGLRERWELREHVDERPGGWYWTVEYVRGGSNGT